MLLIHITIIIGGRELRVCLRPIRAYAPVGIIVVNFRGMRGSVGFFTVIWHGFFEIPLMTRQVQNYRLLLTQEAIYSMVVEAAATRLCILLLS